MKTLNAFKYLGIAALALGLSSCFMNQRQPQYSEQMVDYSAPHHKGVHKMHHDKMKHESVSKKHHSGKKHQSKHVSHKSSPGPKQKAAPQLPVIQQQ